MELFVTAQHPAALQWVAAGGSCDHSEGLLLPPAEKTDPDLQPDLQPDQPDLQQQLTSAQRCSVKRRNLCLFCLLGAPSPIKHHFKDRKTGQ